MPIGRGDLCFAVFDAALVIDIGDSAQGDGRAIFVPGTVWHGTPRAGEANGRVAKHGPVWNSTTGLGGPDQT